MLSYQNVRQWVLQLGFNIVGIIPAQPSPTLWAYFQWIERNMHGEMGYMARPDRQIRRQDLNVILENVQSMVLVGLDYRTASIPDDILTDPTRGRFASYAWNFDYHDVMLERLEELAVHINQTGIVQHKAYVDTGAILERSHAQQAGMGFIGKNTMLIHPRRGSYFFLGEILLDVPFDQYDAQHRETMCGTCVRCLQACPTDAFPEPYVLDSRRCISYLTIEHKGWIEPELRPLMGNWVYGCDICQDVCPWQRFVVPTEEVAFQPPNTDYAATPLTKLLSMDVQTFKQRYQYSPVLRIKRERLVRNACIAAGNSDEPALAPQLRALLNDASPLVRGHAAWALQQLLGESAQSDLSERLQQETDDDVRHELERLLN